jgi:hypothetical protein
VSARSLIVVALLGGCGGGNTSAPAAATRSEATLAASPEPDQIRARVNERLRDVRRCFEGLLERSPGASGKLMIAWHIEPDGTVSNVRVTDATVGDDAMNACVVGVFETMRFSATEKGADATWGFGLTPPAPK